MTALIPLTLPATLSSGSAIDLEFVAASDPKIGVRLGGLLCRAATPYTFEPSLEDVATDPIADGRLWEIDVALRPDLNTSPVKITPAMARSFHAWDASAVVAQDHAFLFSWRGVDVPNSQDGDRFQVDILVTLNDGDVMSRWRGWVHRERGASASIDGFRMPILFLKGPALPLGVETHFEAQKRARFCYPEAISLITPRNGGANSPLWNWLDNGGLITRRLPSGVLMPWCVVASLNSNSGTPDPAYRKMLFFGAEDPAPYGKRFEFQGRVSAADEGYMRLSMTHYPEFIDKLGDQRPTDYGCTYVTPYDIDVGALVAQDDHFWFDAASYYRSRVEAIGFMPPKNEQNPDRTTRLSRGYSPLITITKEANAFKGQEYSDHVAKVARSLRVACMNPFAEPVPTLHLQSYLNNRLPEADNQISNPPADILNDPNIPVMTGLPAVLRELREVDGLIASGYTLPGLLADGPLGWFPPSTVLRYTRDGLVIEAGVPLRKLLNIAAPDHPAFFLKIVTQLIRGGFSAVYLDVFSSTGAGLEFGELTSFHPRFGGRFWLDAKKRLVDIIRALLRSTFGSVSHIMSEAPEEGVSSKLDYTTRGQQYLWGHMLLAEEIVNPAVGVVSDLSDDARWMNPPLWEAVYHDRELFSDFVCAPQNVALATNTEWNPSGGKAGLSAAEFIRLQCWSWATVFVGGGTPQFTVQMDFEGPTGTSNLLVLRDPKNGNPMPNYAKDPTGAGMVIMSYLRAIIAANYDRSYAGQFTLLGEYLRPLSVDYSLIDKIQNPCYDVGQLAGKVDATEVPTMAGIIRSFGIVPQTYFQTQLWTQALEFTFDVPRIYHSMWRSPEGVVGLVLSNWSEIAADWIGTFDPSKYGVATPYTIRRLTLGGAAVVLDAAIGAGTRTVGTSGTTPDTDIGSMGARSIVVLTFETD